MGPAVSDQGSYTRHQPFWENWISQCISPSPFYILKVKIHEGQVTHLFVSGRMGEPDYEIRLSCSTIFFFFFLNYNSQEAVWSLREEGGCVTLSLKPQINYSEVVPEPHG